MSVGDLRLNSPLQYVKGVGPKKAEVLEKFNLRTIEDILFYFPRQYLDRTSIVPITNLKINEPATIIGVVKGHGMLYGRRRRYEMILGDESGNISLIFFHGIRFWEKTFKKGQVFAATGTPTFFQGYQMIHPELERLEEDSDKLIHAGRIIPVYPQTAELNKAGLNSRGIRKITSFVVDNLSEQVKDYLPTAELKNIDLLDLNNAVTKIHYPDNREQVELCRRRLAYDELLGFQFLVYQNKIKKEQTIKKHSYKKPGKKLSQFKKNLPFDFTAGQKKALKEIFDDLQTEHPMNRMLQGDVGCGKTVVAIAAALFVGENKMQTAFMAPTEILAEQHFRNWQEALNELGIKCGLLTSSLKPAEKTAVAELCAEGELDILFGTHALIYDYVSFHHLGLVIIDEQHRFGVEQRGKLYAKGDNPDLLVMTATPIPRTLALTLYGDLDISTIEGLPPGRLPIRTAWRSKDSRTKVYEFVKDEIKKGGQAYIIYPLIEKSENIELENVEDAYKELSNGTFEGFRVGMVHGRTKQKPRDKVLKDFREGKLDILMATTVIEVGIDNPNATVMIIEHSERFGLAQLHQLRGRIGRGEKKSTLIAIAHPPVSEIASHRLKYFVENSDGFKVAEADLELRGPGEMFGIKQSGLPELKAVRLSSDRDLMEKARKLLIKIFNEEKTLDLEYKNLYSYLKKKNDVKQTLLGGG